MTGPCDSCSAGDDDALVQDLIRSIRALSRLVRAEYPAGYSLLEICEEWGPDAELSNEDIRAVQRVHFLATD